MDQETSVAPGGHGLLLFVGAIVGVVLALLWWGQPDPTDQDLLSRLSDNRGDAQTLAAKLSEREAESGPIEIQDLESEDRAVVRKLGVATLRIRDGQVWFEFRTDTGFPWIRVNEPVKSLVWSSDGISPTDWLIPAAETQDETFDFDPAGEFWFVCREVDDNWSLCLDRRG